jgi:hypothetical protein
MKRRLDRLASFLAFAVPFVIYVFSSYRDVTYWDVGEMDTVPYIFGIAHPTGFPAFVIAGWLFTHVIPFGSVAFRMSLLSALALSIAAWLIARIVADEQNDSWIGTVCAWLFAFGIVVWSRATRAEVHALETCMLTAMLYFGLRWYRTNAGRDLVFAACAFGVAIAVHPIALLATPGIIVLVVARLHETPSRALALALGVAVAAAGVWYVYLPLRSAYVTAHAVDPTADLGVSPGRAFWDYDHPASWDGFTALVSGAEFDVAGGMRSIASASTYATRVPKYVATFAREFTVLGVAFTILGIVVALRRDGVRTAALLLVGGMSIPFALGYGDESDVQRYFLPSFVIAAIFVGDACAWLSRRRLRAVAIAAVTGCAVWLVVSGAQLFNQPRDERARREVDEVLRATPDNAVLVATWVLAPPLAYVAYVEHGTGHRTVDAAWYGDEADLLPAWTARRPVYVVGTPEGIVPGFRLERLSTRTALYRVVRE